ncbi:tyrosine-type recombinase/integrase [Nonomuraea sp. NPDC003804]|uniref:tyrosine-type recombinase/integrase n=1 Tax=Nonomuraea sp. NPDC003804 TaxID=3154547 RepID=UPI0033B01FDE
MATSPIRLEPRLTNQNNLLLWRDFYRELRLLDRSDRTIQGYLEAVEQLEDFCDGADLEELTKTEIGDYLLHVKDTHSVTTAGNRFRSLRRFYNWMVDEETLEQSPMRTLKEPKPESKPIPIPPIDDVRKLLATCNTKDHDGYRDEAIIRLFCEPGAPRVAEMAGIEPDRIDFTQDVVAILGKGRKWRAVPFGAKTGKALTRYMRARGKHPLAGSKNPPREMWLGARGKALTPSGIYQMIERRCDLAGIDRIHPHQLRHFAADAWFAAGGSDQDGMRLFGWSSLEMPRRYGAANAEQRAIQAHQRMALGDQL